MNVLQILPRLNIGGVERGTVELAAYLVSEGHKAVVVSEGGFWVERLDRLGAKHYYLPVGEKNPLTMVHSVRQLVGIIEREDIDIVHARSRIPAWIAYRAVRLVNKKRFRVSRYPKIVNFVTTAHGLYSPGYFSRIMGRGKRVIAPSQFIKEHLINNLGVEEKKIIVIPRSVDLSMFEYSPARNKNKYVFAVIGRITKNKGQLIAIQAFSRVAREFPEAQLWIIGEPNRTKSEYLDKLKNETVKLGIHDKVHFLGAQKDVQNWIAKVHVVLVPSIYPESFGRVVLEAQAVGRAVIASDIPALNELIEDGKTGLLAKPALASDWAEKMKILIKNPLLYEKLTQNARRFAERFSLEEMCLRTVEVYKEVLGSYTVGFIKTSALGDIVLGSYALRALERNFSNADIIAITSEIGRQVLQGRDLFIVPQKIPWFSYGRKLKRYGLDITYDLQNSLRSQLLAWISGAYRRFGFSRKLGWLLLTDPVTHHKNYPILEQQYLLEHCGLRGIQLFDCLLEVKEEDKEEMYLKIQANIDDGLAANKSIVGVVVGASWQTKNLEVHQQLSLIRRILQTGNPVVLIGDQTHQELTKEILDHLTHTERKQVANLVGVTTVKDLIALIDVVDIVITPDSAPMHIAYALKRPCIVYFGPTNPKNHLPEPKVAWIKVIHKDICSPCYRKQCPKEVRTCLEGIETEIVTALEDLLLRSSKLH